MSKRKRTPGTRAAVAPPGQLHEMLRDIARWAVASSIGAAAGCSAHQPEFDVRQSEPTDSVGWAGTGAGSAPDTPSGADFGTTGGAGTGVTTAAPPDTPAWKPIECEDARPQVLVNIAFTQPFDYVALYASYASVHEPSTSMLDSRGIACATASDPRACGAMRDRLRLPSEACVDQMQCTSFLLAIEQDAVTRIDERAALFALLGAIDTEYKAAFVAMFYGHVIGCPVESSGGTQTRPSGDGYDLLTEWRPACLSYGSREVVHVAADGLLTQVEPLVYHPQTCVSGRRPEGLCPAAAVRGAPELGAYFADAARLEAASVHAFERLARELGTLGAPSQLIVRAAHAALDEIRHARVSADLARRFGAEPLPARVAPQRERTALEIALENAVEGCVRETWGALLAHHQAHAARDPFVRRAMQQIARDETRHAELSWHVARWLEPRLSPAEQRTLAAARTAALAQLFSELDAGLSPSGARAIGLPAPEVAARMLQRLGAALGVA